MGELGVGQKRIAIVHLGEGIPSDAGYRAGRHGRLARYLTSEGWDVVRIVPSFRHDARVQREIGESHSDEGVAATVETSGYQSNRGPARFRFLGDFIRGTARTLRANPVDVVLVALPPPGMIIAARLASPRKTRVVADIRDLWPDALIPSGDGVKGRLLLLLGGILAVEMHFAHAAVALSERMLARAPRRRRTAVIPIGIQEDAVVDSAVMPEGPLRICFLGNIGYGLDFEPMLEALAATSVPWTFDVYGRGPCAEELGARLAPLEGAEYRGELDGDLVPEVLSQYDIGVVPRVAGFGTCLSNKVFEYLGSGLSVLFRLEPGVGDLLAERGLGARCETTAEWRLAIEDASAKLPATRANRDSLIEMALKAYGGAVGHSQFEFLFERLCTKRP